MRALLFFLAVFLSGPLMARPGTLVIVGGGLAADNAEVYRAFIDGATGGKIAIIPSASGEPQASLDAFTANLVRHGVSPGRIVQIKLAEMDDPATPIDEAAWAANGLNTEEITKIETASAIWFTGGDQARTMRLLASDGKDSPMLAAIRKRLAAGAVIGGTSAGAAVMGSGMIFCGDPARAGTDPVSNSPADCATQEGGSEPLVLGNGLGFFAHYVVDQHFAQRGRLPRLLRAVACGAGNGIGIDEDTALVVDLATHRANVAGKGSVTTLSKRKSDVQCGLPGLQNARLNHYRAGDSFRVSK